MSFILKALKKLEEEKAARQARPRDINSAILAPDRPEAPPPRRRLKFLLGLLLLLAAGGGVTFLLIRKGPAPRPRAEIPAPAVIPSAPAPVPIAPDAAAPRTATPAPAASSAGQPTPVGSAQVPVAPGPAPPPAPRKSPERAARPAVRQAAPVEQPRSERAMQPPTAPAPAGLKVNGIALQDDPAASMAVVNGILVKRGMTVQGLRVEEILSDRVRFSGNGERYEVQISK